MIVTQLVEEVRQKTDEDNTNDLSDEKILMALNRALLRLARLSVRHYPELLKRTTPILPVTTGQLEVPALSQAYHQLQLDVQYGNIFRPLTYTSSTNVVGLESPRGTPYPLYYTQQGNILFLVPPSVGTVNVRLRFEMKPPKLVKEQGRITNFDAETGTIYVDAIADSLTTNVSNLSAFFNVVDQFTGDVKATFQALSLTPQSGRVVVKTTGLGRTTVYGRTVDTVLPTTISLDDYICPASGSCIPLYFREYVDFLIQFAVNDIRSTFGVKTELDNYDLKDIEEDVKLTWSQRPYGARVKANNPSWNSRISGRFRV